MQPAGGGIPSPSFESATRVGSPFTPEEDAMTTATFVTSKGSFSVRLMPEHAPKTVENFIDLASGKREWTDPRDGERKTMPLYDGTVFHRVIDGFMIQGGDPTGSGMGGPGYRFEDEVPPDGPSFDRPGILAMANAGPNTNGSQFFLTVAPTEWLTGRHTIFGEVTEGYDVVESIAKSETAAQDRPASDIVLERVEISEG
jgi:peptidyl-prolyl cis-trans isomerase A (cyclophilin A)